MSCSRVCRAIRSLTCCDVIFSVACQNRPRQRMSLVGSVHRWHRVVLRSDCLLCRATGLTAAHVCKRSRPVKSGKRRPLIGRMATVNAVPARTAASTSAADAAEGGVFQYLGNLCFRSKYSNYLWNTSISAPYRVVRIAAMTLIALLLLARSWKLFVRSAPDLCCAHPCACLSSCIQ